jgi:hypothetical protein
LKILWSNDISFENMVKVKAEAKVKVKVKVELDVMDEV